MTDLDTRPASWTWGVCGLLLLASTINYMDRQTLANTATRVKAEFGIMDEPYGVLEEGFGYAFAAGSLIFGLLADKLDIRWLYPCVLLMWSAAGVATGYVRNYDELLACRVVLGFFEAGHWPCALRTTRNLLDAGRRTFGNSVLQSGTSIGAIVTPLIVLAMLTPEAGSWRNPFIVIGCIGAGWVVLWLLVVVRTDYWHQSPPEVQTVADDASDSGATRRQTVIRILVLAIAVITINITWHLLRVWLPLFLEKGRGYTERERLVITSVYNGFTDIGCILAGAATVWLSHRGLGIQRARVWTFAICALGTAATVLIPWLPRGAILLAVLFLIAAGSLGLFPCYYAFTQEISTRHHGKIFGTLSVLGWLTLSPLHRFLGRYVDQNALKQGAGDVINHAYDLPLAITGLLPLLGAAALLIFWRDRTSNDPIASS
jgi:ACS family hexuronate transporter-like MFS transporter